MNRRYFFSLLSKHLYPVLRAEGFGGSGATLRRIQPPLIHIFNVQASPSGNACYLNLGAHLAFLPPEGGVPVPLQELHEYECVLRGRIEPPPGPAFGWAYCSTPQDAALNVELIVSEWPTQGQAFFATYSQYPRSFTQLLDAADPSSLHARTNLHYARIAAHLKRPEQTEAFARAGLAHCPEHASALRADLEHVLATLTGQPSNASWRVA